MVPEASWLMVTSTPAMGAPLASTTWPLTPAEVLCANAGAAASTAIIASDSLDSRARLRWVISNTSRKAEDGWLRADIGAGRHPRSGLRWRLPGSFPQPRRHPLGLTSV